MDHLWAGCGDGIWKRRSTLDHIAGLVIVPLGISWEGTGHVGIMLIIRVILTGLKYMCACDCVCICVNGLCNC